ncbi:MAG: DUF488 family protein [Acidobacteriaceae bacterium]|nr:DUF488 family protein [Acidobacteriaceae bacterium]
MIQLKRAYDKPSVEDGKRFLVDRLWPRGVKKTAIHLDGWLKELAPSTVLRKWFGHDPTRWEEFRRRYFRELGKNAEAYKIIQKAAENGAVTLVFDAHDTEHNNAVALKEFLEIQAKKNQGSKRAGHRKAVA